jgi:hypothetical protein
MRAARLWSRIQTFGHMLTPDGEGRHANDIEP